MKQGSCQGIHDQSLLQVLGGLFSITSKFGCFLPGQPCGAGNTYPSMIICHWGREVGSAEDVAQQSSKTSLMLESFLFKTVTSM